MHADAACVGLTGVHSELPVNRMHGSQKLPFEGVTECDVDEGVDAAVGVAHADGNVVGVVEGDGRLLHAQVHQLEGVVRSPADEEGQAYRHRHAGHLPRAHPQTPWRQWCHAGGHVLEDFKVHQADYGQRHGKGQKELIKCEPVCAGDRVGQEQSAGHQAVRQRHQTGVHQHGDDGEEGQTPHHHDDQRGHAGGADVVEADWMHRSQVAIEGHGGEDVGADNLAVGVECGDDCTHRTAEVPAAIAQQLVDEKWHPEEEQEVDDGQV